MRRKSTMALGKYFATTTMAAMFVLSSAPISYAADTTPDISIYYNHQKVVSDKKPYINNGTTYVPLRMLSEMFGKTVTFDPKTYNINIDDNPASADTNANSTTSTNSNITEAALINSLQQQISQNNLLILSLEEKVNQLQGNTTTQVPTTQVPTTPVPTPPVPGTQAPTQTPAQSPTTQTSSLSISDLQNLLNGSTYLMIRSCQLSSISLSGDSSQINVEIDTALQGNSNYEHWTDLSSDDVNSYFQNLSSKIRQYYPNAIISGSLKNTSYVGNSDLSDPSTKVQIIATFTTSTDGTVTTSKLY